MSCFADSSFDSSHPALIFDAARNLDSMEFERLAACIGLSLESCQCHDCINDNPSECYTRTEAPLWCCIDTIQLDSAKCTRPKHFQIGMHLYMGIPGERQYMVIVRELTPVMAVLEFVSIISLENGYLKFEPFNGNPREGTAIKYTFGSSSPKIFTIPAFLIKR